jgi:hypothetical protein
MVMTLCKARLMILVFTSRCHLDGRAPLIDNSTDRTTVLLFKNLLNSMWTIKDRRGCHLLLLPHNQRVGSKHR